MAETLLNDLGKGLFKAESAGLESGKLNPNAVKVMAEIGYDISQNKTKRVIDFLKEGRQYSFVIKVCDEMNGQRCPIFPGAKNNINWNLEDPSSFKGTEQEVIAKTRIVRDQIKKRVEIFIKENLEFAKLRTEQK
jgi:arsenate reductase